MAQKTTGSFYSKTGMNPGTSTKDMYTTTSISNISSALNGVLPTKYYIDSVVLNVKASFTANWSAKVYLEFGLGESGDIRQTILEEKQIYETAKSGSETYSRDITQYLKSRTSTDIKTDYGSLLVFRMQSANISKKTYSIDSATLTVTYRAYYDATFKNGETVLQTISVLEGSTPSYTGATPTKERDYQYEYTFSGWSPSIGAITGNTTYTAQFTSKLREYTVEVICEEDSRSGQKATVTGAGKHHYGDTVTLTAVAPPNHEFAYWHGYNGINYDNPLEFRLDETYIQNIYMDNLTHYCTIAHTGFRIKADVTPENAGVVEYVYFYDLDGDEVRETWYKLGTVPPEGYIQEWVGKGVYGLNAVPNNGYKFVRWSDGNTENPRQLNLESDVTITAIFEKMKGTVILDCYDEFLEEYEWWLDHVTITGLNAGENVLECGQKITLTIECRDGYICDFLRVLVTDDDDMSTDLFPGDYNGNSLTFKIVREGTTIIQPCVRKEIGVVYVHTSVDFGENEAVENNCTVTGLELGYNELDIGREVTLTAVPDKGYRFSGIAIQKSEPGFEEDWGDVDHCLSLPDGYITEESSITFTVICEGVSTIQVFFEKFPEFTSVDMIYLDKQISPTNKVIAGQSFIISATIE